MPKLQLSFHGTFALKKEDLLKIINVCDKEKGLNDSKENLIKRTGLGTQKVTPMKSWATRVGLVNKNYLSTEGKLVFDKDPYLTSLNTEWFMHFYLSFGDKGLAEQPEYPAEWGGWSYFIYTFLPENRVFTIEELQHRSAVVFDEENEKNILKNFRLLLRAYLEPQALAACKFITKEDERYITGYSRLPNPYMIGYFLAKLWERDFKNEGSVLTESILNQKMGLAPVLGLKPEALQEQLNTLEAYGIIEQRRAVPPFQVIPRWDSALVLLEKAYGAEL